MKKYLIFSLISALIIFSQCNYHNIDEYFDDIPYDTITNCDTVDVSFSQTVFPIIVNNCVACHNDITHYKDRNYETYEGITDAVNSGILLKVINHTPAYVKMPWEGNKLPQCYIDIIEAWVDQGMKNN